MELTSKQRANLRSLASKEDTLFQIGKGGITPTVTQKVSDALDKRELIKLRVLETAPDDVRDVADEIAQATGSEVVVTIGSKLVLFKKKKKNSAYNI